MEHLKTILAIIMLLGLAAGLALAGQTEEDRMTENIAWLGHDTFRITAEKTIYTDPFRLKSTGKADLILITHEHRDHCSIEDVKMIATPETVIVTTASCATKLAELKADVRIVKPGDTLTVKGIEVQAVPAYNTNKKFHPKENQWVGYIFKAGGQRIYLAGDTDRIPEMKDLRCDVALLPVSGTYVMTAEEAAEAALDIKPRLAVPMHYAEIVGTLADAEKFAALLKNKVPVKILPLSK